MPWQRYVADVGCELLPTGLPAYREVILTVPRQSGKTEEFLSWQIDRSLNWGKPQRSAFTAQSGKDARDKWLDELFPLIRNSKLKPLIAQINEGMGNESIRWKTGSIIRLLSTSTSSGHSKTLDQAVLDEIWHDVDDRREQGLRPALITRSDAQLLVCSTAGTQASTVLNRKRRAGRLAVEQDMGFGVAYFEWSAPDEWDPSDEESYFSFMPALCPDPPCRCGARKWRHTIELDAISAERLAMEPMEFVRAYGNRTTQAADELIPADVWQKVCSQEASPQGEVRFALDVAEDRSSAAICAASGNVIELIDHHRGTEWVAARANQLTAKHNSVVWLDSTGPANALIPELNNSKTLNARQVVDACGAMYDAIIDAKVVFRSHPDLDQAIAGVAKQRSGDTWRWSRKSSSSDITPLVAATLALAARSTASLVTF
jgi:hypothetical protein